MIGEKMEASTVSWKEKAKECHEKRWEYLHSPMHAAGMALDPEFMERAADFDESTQEGLMTVVERLSLLDVIFESANPAAAQLTLTTESPKVAERISNTMTELAKYQANEGIFTKAHVMMAAKTMPPAVWWATYGKPLPLLSAVARRVLAWCWHSRCARRLPSATGPCTARSRRARPRAWATSPPTSGSTATRPCTSRRSYNRPATSRTRLGGTRTRTPTSPRLRPTWRCEYFLGVEAVCRRQSALLFVCVCTRIRIGPPVNTPMMPCIHMWRG